MSGSRLATGFCCDYCRSIAGTDRIRFNKKRTSSLSCFSNRLFLCCTIYSIIWRFPTYLYVGCYFNDHHMLSTKITRWFARCDNYSRCDDRSRLRRLLYVLFHSSWDNDDWNYSFNASELAYLSTEFYERYSEKLICYL